MTTRPATFGALRYDEKDFMLETQHTKDQQHNETGDLVEDAKRIAYKLLGKVNEQRFEEMLGAYGPIGESLRPIDNLRLYLQYALTLAKELRK